MFSFWFKFFSLFQLYHIRNLLLKLELRKNPLKYSYYCLIQCVLIPDVFQMFQSDPDDLDMHVIYDVSHNIAKVEEHMVDGKSKTLLVHRKGSTRAFPPHHPLISVDYQVKTLSPSAGRCIYTSSKCPKAISIFRIFLHKEIELKTLFHNICMQVSKTTFCS